MNVCILYLPICISVFMYILYNIISNHICVYFIIIFKYSMYNIMYRYVHLDCPLSIPSLVCPSQGCLEQIAVCDKTAHCTLVMFNLNPLLSLPGVQ